MSSQHFVDVHNFSLINNPSHPTAKASSSSSGAHLKLSPHGNEAKVKRPRNAFMLFRRDMWAMIKSNENKDEQQNELSKGFAAMWNNMSEEERGPWVADAKRERDQHKRDHPDFQYYQGSKKRRIAVQRDDKLMSVDAPIQHQQNAPSTRRRRQRRSAHTAHTTTSPFVHAAAFTSQVPQPSSPGAPSGPFNFGLLRLQPSRSRTTSTTPGPATPFATDYQTIDPVIAQMALINEPLERSFGAICGQPDQYGSQQQYSQPLNGTYATEAGVVECENQWTKNAGPNLPSSNTKLGNVTQGHPYSTDFASVGAYDGAMSSQPFGPPSFLESNGVPFYDFSGDFAALPVPSDDAALFGGTSGFVQSDMASHNDVPHYGAHTAYGFATEFSAPPSFQQTHPEAHSMQPQLHPTHSAQVNVSQTQPIVPLEAPVASQKASIAPPTAPFISPELASVPLRRCHRPQQRQEGAPETVSYIPSAEGPSSRNLATKEREAPPRGYLRAPHEYTVQDRLSDNAPSPNELDPPSHAHSVPQATASSHRRTVSASSYWPAPRDFRKHLRFCSDTPITRPSVQRTGDWLTDWQASGLANARSDLSASAQLDAFANVPFDPLAQDAPYANAPTAPYAAQESGSYMDALSTSYSDAPAISWMQVPTTSYEQPAMNSYTDAQTRSYVEPMMTTSSQTPAFPSAPAAPYTQPSTSYEQGSANSYPDPATQPYPNAPLDSYSQASGLPYPDGPIPPHVDLTTPYYNPVNHQYGSRVDHC
ncbi:hypothetical protein K525DRAFT_248994 [Schizophyllum commune Loenen D]|nr:hypothetical protein K525DRAFT_248994 [Schizophyllum commune Loenen D]